MSNNRPNQAPQNRPMGRPGGPMGGPGRGPRSVFVEKPKDFKTTFKKLIKYINYRKGLFISLMLIMVVMTILSLLSPILQKEIIDALDFESKNYGWDNALKYIIMLSIVYVFVTIFSYLRQMASSKLSQETVRKIRTDLFEKFVKLPIKFLDTHSHGDLMSRMTNDVENISNTISQSIASLISGVMTIIGTLSIMIYYSWFLTLVTMITVVLTLVLTKILTGKMRKYFKAQSSILGELNGHAEEMITGYKTVVAYNKEEKVINEFNNISNKYTRTSILAQIWGGSMGPIMNFIGNLGYVLVAAVGAYIAVNNPFGMTLSIGTIILFLNSSRQFTRPINEIANLYGQILTATACAERVFEILDSENEVDKGTIKINDEEFKGNIEFNHINFSYVEGQPVLKDFTLSVKPGQKIALVGATGSGKTTVVNLLMRFYDVDSGEILIDGVNINDIPKYDLRNTIAIVLQDTVLFKDTIKNNLKYGNADATDEEVKAAGILSNSNYFIRNLTDKYDTVLSEGGSNLSQGQRQLLSIGRAVLADPKILILDEATSSVDTRTEKNIQDAMANLMHNRTSLIIAHRLSTIQDSDVIVVIDKGEIVEQGNHYELLKKQGKYYDLYMTQFAGKEI
ncbi:MAG: ABC transporter ATP-binding protein [Bacilli bacterium]|nr:ABC transporter ATP-binding protein [Bacilli bacterium]